MKKNKFREFFNKTDVLADRKKNIFLYLSDYEMPKH
jgi:hypothetical protein